jgi:hypothetical protein
VRVQEKQLLGELPRLLLLQLQGQGRVQVLLQGLLLVAPMLSSVWASAQSMTAQS